MVEQPEKKMYRIGPYAYYLGVTPDLLKHYEQFQLVESVPSESGYRYYPFSQSPGLLCAMTLRGYGIPLKEIDVLLHDDEPEKAGCQGGGDGPGDQLPANCAGGPPAVFRLDGAHGPPGAGLAGG